MEYQLINSEYSSNTNLTVIERVLTNRGIELNDIYHYLNTTDEDILNPLLLNNMDEGLRLVAKCVRDGKPMFIQVDSDCDGMTSAAVFINYLHRLFPAYVENNVIYRMHSGKQHGILPSTIPDNVGLVVAPDSSSNSYEEHKILKDKGIDVLVLDHHEAAYESEDACVINNQLCDYPTKSLSGAGIVFKFCSYIDEILNVSYADDLLDLVALGIIADMSDIRDFETRYILTEGLLHINNPFLKVMIANNAFSIGDEVTPIGIAFYVAPYVNAVMRVGTQSEKQLLLESMLTHRAHNLIPSTKRGCVGQMETVVEQACRTSNNVKNRQTKTRDSAIEIIEKLIVDKGLLNNKILIVQLDEKNVIDKNLTGLVANQLMAKYQRPALVLNKIIQEDKTILWSGSARGYDKSKLKNFRQFFNSTGLVELGEGHPNAFGAAIKDENISEFIEKTNELLKTFDFTPCYNVDFIFNGDSFQGIDIITLADYKCLWGQEIDEPIIALENIKITADNISLMSPDKRPTLKIKLANGTELIKFKSSKEEYDKLNSELGCIIITVIGRCDKNVWNGKISPQIIIEDYEITNKMEYYF